MPPTKNIILNPKRNTLGNTAISAQRPVYASTNTISIMTGTTARSKSEELVVVVGRSNNSW